MSVRITDLPEATELNGSELMPIVQNGVTRRTTLDFVNQAAPAALILQQTQQVLADTQQVLVDTQQVKDDTLQVYDNTQQVYVQTTVVQGEVENSLNEWETQYLGSHPAPPTLDNDGNVLRDGALYWDTTLNAMFVWNGVSWTAFSSAVASVNGQIGEVILDYADVGAANSGANDNITSMSGVTGDIGSTTGLQFNTLTPSTAGVGKLTWNTTESTLDLGLNAAGVVQQIGQEVLYTVRNTTGAVIPNGSSVRVIGTEPLSGRLLVAPAAADGSVKSQTFLGLTTESINPGEDGFVTHFGKVRGINTTGAIYGETWVAGDVLYAHPATPGGLTKTAPQAPRNVILMALVIEAAANGTLLVRPTYGDNFQNSESVALSGLAEGDVLWYSATQGRFENRTLTAAGIEAFGTAADSMAAHLAASDPHPQYTTSIEAAAAAPVQSVAGKTGAVSLAKADVGLANVDNTSDADKPISTATQNALNLKLNSNDPSVTNAREWTAETVSQVEAEAGTATTRRAWTAERVFQAIAAWWNASAFKTKLDNIEPGAQVNTVNSVAGKVGIVTLVKGDVGLANVDNTSDLNKPVSTAQAAAIAVAEQNVIDTLTAASGSNIVGFQQAGAGSVVRTAQDKMREWVSIKDFGAVGDGVTDDTQACKLAADYLRARGGGTLHIPDGTYCVWTALPSPGEVLFDWNGCRGVTVIYSNSKILAVRPNTATGDTVAAIIHGLENVQRFTVINPAAEQVGSVIPANGGIVQFGVGMAGGANQSSGIKIINARQIGGLGGLIVYPSGAPNDRAHTIELDGYFEGVCYPQNFQGNGDNYRGRVTTRNCGRSYFPYNVAGHDVYVDSNNGAALDDINISAYTATTLRSETSGIKVRYRNYGSASLGNAVHFGFIQSDGVSRAAQIRDVTVELDMQVGTYPGVYVMAKKYDSSGAADNTARGHSFVNIEIRGSALGAAALNPVQFFNAENWTGESVYGLRFRDLQITSQTAGGQQWVIDGRGIKKDGGGITFENVFTNVPISKTNMPQGVQTIRNVSESSVPIDGEVGNWTISYMPHGLCMLTYIGGRSVPNGTSTTLTLPFADKRGSNPHVVITPKGVQCKFTATALTAQTFSISHDHTASVTFDVFVLMYV